MNAKQIIVYTISIFLILPVPSYAQTPATPSAAITETITQENTLVSEKQVEAQVTTGENNGQNIEEISTGDANAEVNVTTNANTNVEGSVCTSSITTDTETQGTIDLSTIDNETCIASSSEATSSAKIDQTNTAQVTNEINLSVKTGGNEATGAATTIQTGTASVKVDVANIVNTNISGENAYFGVINLLEDHEGDIILPYELGFISGTGPIDLSSDEVLIIQQLNTGLITNNVQTLANTGNNKASQLTSGEANTTIQIVDRVNTNVLDSSFLILDINTFGTWDGRLQGWWGTTEQTEVASATDIDTTQQNKAKVTNDITVETDTGHNSVEEGTIITGDSTIDVNIFNMVNTNIAGNNWFYMVINVFDSLKGDIIFPRPDLGVSVSTNTTDIVEGEELEYKVRYDNSGLVFAKDTKLEFELPKDVELTSMTSGGVLQDNTLIWDLQKLQKNTSGEVFIRVKPQVYNRSLLGKAFISTSMFEPNRLNNISILEFVLNLVKRSTEQIQPESDTEETAKEVSELIAEIEKPITGIALLPDTYTESSANPHDVSAQPSYSEAPIPYHSSQEVQGASTASTKEVQTSSSLPYEYIYFSWIGLLLARIVMLKQ